MTSRAKRLREQNDYDDDDDLHEECSRGSSSRSSAARIERSEGDVNLWLRPSDQVVEVDVRVMAEQLMNSIRISNPLKFSDSLVRASVVLAPGSAFRRALSEMLRSESLGTDGVARIEKVRQALLLCLQQQSSFRRNCVTFATARAVGGSSARKPHKKLSLKDEMSLCAVLAEEWLGPDCRLCTEAAVLVKTCDHEALGAPSSEDDCCEVYGDARIADGFTSAERRDFRRLLRHVIEQTGCDRVPQYAKTYEQGFLSVAPCSLMWTVDCGKESGEFQSSSSITLEPTSSAVMADHKLAELIDLCGRNSLLCSHRIPLEDWR
jgi:hypothetical protein